MSTKKNPRRAMAVNNVRAISEKFTRPLKPNNWPSGKPMLATAYELLGGMELVNSSVHDDIESYFEPMLDKDSPHKLPARLKSAIKVFASEPSLARLTVVQVECRKALTARYVHGGFENKGRLGDPMKPKYLRETLDMIEELDKRLDIWAAAVGCKKAALRCAARAFQQWSLRSMSSSFRDPLYHGAILSTLEYLAAANLDYDGDFDTYVQETRRAQLDKCLDDAHMMSAAVSIVREALDMPRPYDEFEPQLDEPADTAGKVDPGPQDLSDVEEDRAGIARLPEPPAKPEADALPEVPGLVVIGDISHLKRPSGKHDQDPAKEVAPIAGVALPLVPPPADLAATRAELLAESPHAERVVDRILRPLAEQRVVRIPPVLIWGPPGGGKTRLARRIGEALDLQPSVLSMAGITDSVPITGTPKGWSTAGFGIAIQKLLQSRIANPMVVVDEGDKIGTSRTNGNACDALINLLGTETSARYRDVYLQAEVDASHFNWIITANSLDTVPRALLDRCMILRLDEPGPEHLRTLAVTILAEIRQERGQSEAWLPPLDGIEWNALEEHWNGGSLRGLRRLVEGILDARDAGPRQ